MKTSFKFIHQNYEADLRKGTSLVRMPSIFPVDTEQAFDVGNLKIEATAFKDGDFIGDVAAGGSCNVDVLKINPHCSTTHTETVLHIVHRQKWALKNLSVADVEFPIMIPCILLSVELTSGDLAQRSGQTYQPEMATRDQVVTEAAIAEALENLKLETASIKDAWALVIRTPQSGRWSYDSADAVPYLTREAMALVSDSNCRHLLVDLPSVDRRADDGLLVNHHQFWNVDDDGRVESGVRSDRTITELLEVPTSLRDGVYLLDLQLIPLPTDATLSCPVLFSTEQTLGSV